MRDFHWTTKVLLGILAAVFWKATLVVVGVFLFLALVLGFNYMRLYDSEGRRRGWEDK